MVFFFFKQKTAYEMRISDWSSDVCSSDLVEVILERATIAGPHEVTLASGRTVTAKFILIATGATPHVPSCPGHEHGITSNEAFHLDAIPKRILDRKSTRLNSSH